MPIIVLIVFLCHAAFAVNPPPISPPIQGQISNRTDAAVIIGNEAYQKFPQVIYAVNDAKAMRDFVTETLRISNKSIHYRENSKKRDMLKAIVRMAKKVKRANSFAMHASKRYTSMQTSVGSLSKILFRLFP